MTGIVPIRRYFSPSLLVDILGFPVEFRGGQGLAMRFRVTRSMSASPDTGEVEIIGLDPKVQEKMGALYTARETGQLVIRGGYESALAGVFRGDLRSLKTNDPRGADILTIAVADDGGEAVAEVPLRISNAGMTSAQMIEVAAAALELIVHPSAATVLAEASVLQQSPFTAVVTGHAVDLLDAACRRLRCRWWTRDGQLFLLTRRGVVDKARPAVEISEKARIANPSMLGGGLYGVPTMFDPNIVPGSQVVVDGKFLRVETVVHSGLTRGSDVWRSEVVGRILEP